METITISKRKPTDAWFKTFLSILLIALIFGFSSCQDESSNQLTEDYLKGLELGTPSGTSQSAPVVYFEKRRFTRTTDAPFEEIVRLENPNFEHFSGDFVLKIQNGCDKQTRVSSAEIIVDGETIVSQSDFSKNVPSISKRLEGLTPESVLEVRINSTPGCFFELWIEGTLKPDHVQVTAKGGEFVFLGGILTLSIPEGAVNEETIISVNDFTNLLTDQQRTNFDRAFEFHPDQIEFALPILGQIILPDFSEEDDPMLFNIEQTYGVEIPSWYSTESKTLIFSLSHFSDYYIRKNGHKLITGHTYHYSLTKLNHVLAGGALIMQRDFSAKKTLRFLDDDLNRAFNRWLAYSEDFNTILINDPDVTTSADITVGFLSEIEAANFGLGKDILEANAIVLYKFDNDKNLVQRHILLKDDLLWNTSELYAKEFTQGQLIDGLPAYFDGQPSYSNNRFLCNVEGTLIHEIGHLFGLRDRYPQKSYQYQDCNRYLSVMGDQYGGSLPISLFGFDIENLKDKYNVASFRYSNAVNLSNISNLEINVEPTNNGELKTGTIETIIEGPDDKGIQGVTVIFHTTDENLGKIPRPVSVTNEYGIATVDFIIPEEEGAFKIIAQAWLDPITINTGNCPRSGGDIKRTVTFNINVEDNEGNTNSSYSTDFSGSLSDWIPIDGSWQIQNGRLIANYGIGCGSIGCPQADLILKDQFQPQGDWELSVDFTYAPDNSYNYGASGAAIIIWESPNKKIRIGIGNGGTVPWGTNPETIMPVSFCAWDGSWDNSRWNYINYTWRPMEWHTMTIDKTGNVYTVYVDDDYLWRYTDNYMNGTGKIGLQTYGPKIYDNFIIRTKD